MSPLGTQPLLNIIDLVRGRNVVIVEQPFPRSQASVDNRKFAPEISLANAVSMTIPSVINYVLYVADVV